MRGIDISSWQAGIIPSKMGIDFCIVKATEGTNYTNPYCDPAIEDCINSAINWGFYHFANKGDAIAEAKYFVSECENYFGKGIPILDYECWQGNDVSWCETFLKQVHELTGIWPMLYISASNCGTFEKSWIPDKCGLWVAGYPVNYTNWIDENTPMNYSIYPWKFAAIWQFTSSLRLANWNGGLDGDIAYMDSESWQKYAGKKTVQNAETPKKNNAPTGKTCEQIADEVMAGKWGTGWNREQALNAAYGPGTYEHVQSIINDRLK